MQNTMLDSTIPKLLQDNSSVEYVDAQKNPIATTPNGGRESVNSLFDFHAVHNGEACIESLDPKDRGTERQFWFTVVLLCRAYECSADTIRRRVETLAKTGDINETQNCVSLNVPNQTGNGAVKTMLYDLTVFNKLAMTFIDNPRAVEVRNKFNDVLVKHETGVTQPELTDEEIMSRALEIAHRTLALREERIKALTAERDEAVRTKYHFVEGRDAKVCGELGGLRTQNEALRKQIGDSKTYKAVTAITWLPDYFNMSNRGLYGSLAANLKKIGAGMASEFKPIDIPDSRFGKVKAYHVDVIERLHEMVQADENLMKKYRKIASV